LFPENFLVLSKTQKKEVRRMEWLAFIFSVLALVLSVWALRRTGGLAEMKTKVENLSSLGLTEMKKQMESLSPLADSLRGKTADLFNLLEKKVRGEEKPEEKLKREEGIQKEEGEKPK
jgi:hypothetical protein